MMIEIVIIVGVAILVGLALGHVWFSFETGRPLIAPRTPKFGSW